MVYLQPALNPLQSAANLHSPLGGPASSTASAPPSEAEASDAFTLDPSTLFMAELKMLFAGEEEEQINLLAKATTEAILSALADEYFETGEAAEATATEAALAQEEAEQHLEVLEDELADTLNTLKETETVLQLKQDSELSEAGFDYLLATTLLETVLSQPEASEGEQQAAQTQLAKAATQLRFQHQQFAQLSAEELGQVEAEKDVLLGELQSQAFHTESLQRRFESQLQVNLATYAAL